MGVRLSLSTPMTNIDNMTLGEIVSIVTKAKESDEWRSLYYKVIDRNQKEESDKAKELSKDWEINTQQDYWLVYYILKRRDLLKDITEEEVRAAHTEMMNEMTFPTANMIRPIMSRSFRDDT